MIYNGSMGLLKRLKFANIAVLLWWLTVVAKPISTTSLQVEKASILYNPELVPLITYLGYLKESILFQGLYKSFITQNII
jgi:hypothetical protein